MPFVFAAHTTAQSAQVNSDFSAVVNCVNAIDAAQITSGTVNTARIAGAYTGITSVGTIAAGTWQGTAVATAFGGTGTDVGTAFTASTTPSISCGSGTITTLGNNFQWQKTVGKIVFIHGFLGITTNGSCAGTLIITSPTSTTTNANCGGFVINGHVALGKLLQGALGCNGNAIVFTNYDATYPAGDGFNIIYSGWYESI